MYACAVHGDEDVNRWNTLRIPRIDAGIGNLDRVIMDAAFTDMLCALCQRKGLEDCIKKFCNKAFILAFAAAAERPFAVTGTILRMASLSTVGPLSARTSGARMMMSGNESGAGVEDPASLICAYCLRFGDKACIRRWCITGLSHEP